MEQSQKIEKSVKRIKSKVIFSDEKIPDYIPMHNVKGMNEWDLIIKTIDGDVENWGTKEEQHVTLIQIKAESGTGKTVLSHNIARHYKCPIVTLNCVASLQDIDLYGSHVLVDGETLWQDGPIPMAIRAANKYKTCVLLMNEFNALPQNTQMGMNSLFDLQNNIIIAMNNNEEVKLNDDSQLIVIATMNPNYGGTDEIQKSVVDRTAIELYFDYLDVDAESQLISKHLKLPIHWATKFSKVAHESREKYKKNDLPKAISTRSLINWIVRSAQLTPQIAYEVTIINKLADGEPQFRENFESIARGEKMASWGDLGNWKPQNRSKAVKKRKSKAKPKSKLSEGFLDELSKMS